MSGVMDEAPADQLRGRLGLLLEAELAVTLGVRIETLRVWRTRKIGPNFVKLGKAVFYRLADIETWVANQVVITKKS
jgi:predicted DNA-binding transcriptional regulator AlpA